MILFPNCKINLGLHITGKRNDGYHDLLTIFYPIPLYDALEIITDRSSRNEIAFFPSGNPIPGRGNICIKAWELIKKDFSDIPPVQIFLHKAIPTGAGLGGGSADGAFTLMLLNKKLGLGIDDDRLKRYALQLGSDCPFFLLNKPCLATGRGEMMKEIAIDLGDYYFILIDPAIHISTAWAFNEVIINTSARNYWPLPIEHWKETLTNDFEQPVFNKYPVLRELKEQLYAKGAVYASLTGTGSCVYGIFHKKNMDVQLKTDFTVYYLNKKS